MKKFDRREAQEDIDQLKKQDSIKRRLRADTSSDLQKYATQILIWAHCKGGSKRKIRRLLLSKFGLDVSADKIYRFVRNHNNGLWPNSRNKSLTGASND